MAVYFLRSKHLSRGQGARATRAAAYRAGERIHDERTSEVYDHSGRQDVIYKEVVLPADLESHPDMAWTQDRETLWNAAEHAGLRCNSRLAREWLVLLSPELTLEQRTQLVRTFARELADKYRCAVDACMHLPRPGADPRNHHAHLLMTTREVTPDGFGPRTSLELGGRERHLLGIEGSSRAEYVAIRERWAQVTNEALQRAGLEARIDHRSFKRQGIDREPTPTIPEKVFYAERRSQEPSAAGDSIRARHRERVEARRISGGELTRVIERQRAELKDMKLQRAQSQQIRWGSLTREERNEKRRERYRLRRELEKQDTAGELKRRQASRESYHARMHQDPQAVREARRQWRKAHAEEVNKKQREYRKTHAQELALKRREYRKSQAEQARERPHKEVARGDSKQRSLTSSPTAEESARRWKEYRERHGPGPTADDSARNWLALRELQGSSDARQSATPRNYGEGHQSASSHSSDDDDDNGKPRRQRDHSHDFEM